MHSCSIHRCALIIINSHSLPFAALGSARVCKSSTLGKGLGKIMLYSTAVFIEAAGFPCTKS